MWPNPQEIVDLNTFTGEVLNRKLHFFVQCRKRNKKYTLRLAQVPYIALPLTNMFNSFIKKVKFPTKWKKARTSPILRARTLTELTVCYYHVTYEFQSESTLYSQFD